jgi:hypothetical protein
VREQVVADADLLLGEQEALVIVLEDLARRDSTLIGFYRDGCAVTVRAGDHQDVIPGQPVIARKDVRRQIGAGQMADVQIAVGIGPGNGHMNVLGHGFTSAFGAWLLAIAFSDQQKSRKFRRAFKPTTNN